MAARRCCRAPLGWVNNMLMTSAVHRTGCITTPTLDKKGSGVHFRLFEGRLNLYRTVPHADKLLPWLIVCAAAKIQNKQKAGRGEESLRGDRHPTGRCHSFEFKATTFRPFRAVCARPRPREALHPRPGPDRGATTFLVRRRRIAR